MLIELYIFEDESLLHVLTNKSSTTSVGSSSVLNMWLTTDMFADSNSRLKLDSAYSTEG